MSFLIYFESRKQEGENCCFGPWPLLAKSIRTSCRGLLGPEAHRSTWAQTGSEAFSFRISLSFRTSRFYPKLRSTSEVDGKVWKTTFSFSALKQQNKSSPWLSIAPACPQGAGRAAGPLWAPTTSRGGISHSINQNNNNNNNKRESCGMVLCSRHSFDHHQQARGPRRGANE